MKRGKGNVPEFAKFMNKKSRKAKNEWEEETTIDNRRDSNTTAKGQSMKNSNVSHRTCK